MANPADQTGVVERSFRVSAQEIVALLGPPKRARASQHVFQGAAGTRWDALVAAMVQARYPNAAADERQVLQQAFCNAFATSTDAQYASRFRDFAAFAAAHTPVLEVLPAPMESVHLYLVYLATKGTLAGSAFPEVVSSINAIHRLCGLPILLVDDPVHKLLLQGFARSMVPAQPTHDRQAFLVDWVPPILQAGLSSRRHDVVAACACVVLGLCLGVRGSTLAAIQVEHVHVHGDTFVVSSDVLKTQPRPRKFSDWCFDCTACPSVARLLGIYKALRTRVAGPSGCFWALKGPAWSEANVDGALVLALSRAGVNPACPVTSHCLRIGTVSYMHALGLSDRVIQYWLKWQSVQMIALYVRPVSLSAMATNLFGWMAAAPPTLYV